MCQLVSARKADLPVCMEILNAGRDFQRSQGFVQWEDGYPDADTVLRDMEEGCAYLVKTDGGFAAYLYLGFDGDPAYPEIRGQWLYDAPYGVIHRIAMDSRFRGIGLSAKVFALAEEHCLRRGVTVLRIDTHADNKRMQHVLTKNGFVLCGIVMQDGGERLAFEKKLG